MKRILLVMLCFLAACARAERLPGDSVAADGSVSFTGPALQTNVTSPPPPSREALSPIEARLYPAELIIEQKKLIGLSPAQQEAITKEVDRSQTDLVKLQWELQTKKDELIAILSDSKVDESRASKAADALMQRENAIKSAHLAMLVRIKNILTAPQQTQLAAAREAARCEADAGR